MDVTALLRDNEDTETTIAQAQLATQILQGDRAAASTESLLPDGDDISVSTVADATSAPLLEEPPPRDGRPSFEQLMVRVQAYGIAPEQYQAYADRRWGRGWKINPNGRAQAWNELERYGNDPQGYCDKIGSEMKPVSLERRA